MLNLKAVFYKRMLLPVTYEQQYSMMMYNYFLLLILSCSRKRAFNEFPK